MQIEDFVEKAIPTIKVELQELLNKLELVWPGKVHATLVILPMTPEFQSAGEVVCSSHGNSSHGLKETINAISRVLEQQLVGELISQLQAIGEPEGLSTLLEGGKNDPTKH